MRQRGPGGRCRLRPLGASPGGTTGTHRSLPVRAGPAGTPVAAAGLRRPAGCLLAASGYQEREVRPSLEFNDGFADTVVMMCGAVCWSLSRVPSNVKTRSRSSSTW